jgi:chitodextrinase
VRAFDAAGNRSAPVEVCGIVPDTTPPSAPSALDAAALGETSVEMEWGPSTDDVGVVGYEVYRDDRVVAQASGTRGRDDGLRPSSAYCFAVRAYDAAGNRSEPSPTNCVATPDLTPPSAPAEAAATPLSDRSLRVVWGASTDNVGVAGYDVLRDGNVVTRSLESTAVVSGLSPGRDYCVEVQAFDAAGLRSPLSAPACAHTPDLTPPTVPAGLLAAATSSSRVSVGWSRSEDDVAVAGYEIWRGDVMLARSVATTWLETSLGPTSEYCYQLRAFDAAGNVSDRSPPVCARTTEVGTLAAPMELEVDPESSRAVTLKWKPSPDPDVVYAVFWDGEKRIGSTRYLTYKVDGLKAGGRRCFRVAAVDEAGKSSPKTWPVCAETPAASSVSSR